MILKDFVFMISSVVVSGDWHLGLLFLFAASGEPDSQGLKQVASSPINRVRLAANRWLGLA
jgi:hypothetical protein